MRYVAGSLNAAGHDVHIISFKELRSKTVPSEDTQHHKKLQAVKDVIYIVSPEPGRLIYLPYPTPVTEKEKQILVEILRDRLQVDIIGFSFYSVTFPIACKIAHFLKQEIPGTPIIFGGLHCIVAPDECIETADIVCTGEGEDAMVELMDRWDEYKKEGALDIHGLWFKKPDGEIVKNPRRPAIMDLDRLPFPTYGENEILIDDDAESDKMNKPGPFLNAHVYTFTERGCPYHCSYCIHSVLKKGGYEKFRRRSVDNVMEECRDRVERLGMRHMIFHDEIFIIDKKWVSEFTEKFRKLYHEPYGVTFTGYVHPRTSTPEMVDMMVKAGLSRVGMGIQSGSPRINKDIFDRVFDPEASVEMAKLLATYDFDIIQYDLLVNNPFEREEDMKITFDLLMKFPPPFYCGMFGIVIYRYSKLAEKPVPEERPDQKTYKFWNMMYYLASQTILSREEVRGISENPWYREHPDALERLCVDIEKAECEKVKICRELAEKKENLENALEWIKAHSSEDYPLKQAVKKKIKKILSPFLNNPE